MITTLLVVRVLVRIHTRLEVASASGTSFAFFFSGDGWVLLGSPSPSRSQVRGSRPGAGLGPLLESSSFGFHPLRLTPAAHHSCEDRAVRSRYSSFSGLPEAAVMETTLCPGFPWRPLSRILSAHLCRGVLLHQRAAVHRDRHIFHPGIFLASIGAQLLVLGRQAPPTGLQPPVVIAHVFTDLAVLLPLLLTPGRRGAVTG